VNGEDRKYYQLTKTGEQDLEEREKRIEEIGETSENMVLGFLNVYEDIYGEKRLDQLLEKMKEEFDL